MYESVELVELLDTLEEVKKCMCDAQGEKRKFLIWLQNKAEKTAELWNTNTVMEIQSE